MHIDLTFSYIYVIKSMNHSSLSCEQLIRLDVNHHVMVTVCLPPQSTLLAGAEMSVELVSDFAELVATMPEQIDHTPQPDTPPILACGDSSIATAALAMLQVQQSYSLVLHIAVVRVCLAKS